MLVGYTDAFDADREALRAWLQQRYEKHEPFDQIAARLISASGDSALEGAVNYLARHPDDPVVSVCRMFLGRRLDCARCHDHPFDRWTQDDFARMQRFFRVMQRRRIANRNVRLFDDASRAVGEPPQFLTGAQPRTTQWRDELALFVTRCKPFARNYANRLWHHFFGRGIVDPPDDFHAENPPVAPELLEWLAERAQRADFDRRAMIRTICNSQAYQLSSQRAEQNHQREALFAYHAIKPLTAEQALDSLTTALGEKLSWSQRRDRVRRLVGQSVEEDFSNLWEYRETVQSLLTRLAAQLPLVEGSLDELFLRTLTRRATDEEKRLCSGRSREEVIFALVNGNEFCFNH